MEKKRTIVGIGVGLALVVAGSIYFSSISAEKEKAEIILLEESKEEVSKISQVQTKENKSTSVQEIKLESEALAESSQDEVVDDNRKKQNKAILHVCGEVRNPGVYSVDCEARVIDAIKAAGGFTKEAAEDAFNQADFITDGQRIYVPSKKEIESLSETEIAEVVFSSSAERENKDGSSNKTKVNINKATKEELMTIPGIGESKAESILAYRLEHGKFTTIEELQNISGIKSAIFNKMKDGITVGK